MSIKSENYEALLKKNVLNFYNNSLNFSLDDDEITKFDWELQEKFLNKTVKSPKLIKYPVNKEFSRLYFKKLIQLLQDKQEIHDEFYTALCSAVTHHNENKFYYRHYIVENNLNELITIKETKNLVVDGTTGMRTWEAALMLADWALCNRRIFENRNILELGSGVGLTGITIAKYCDVKSIHLTDCHSMVLDTISENIEINFPDADQNEDSNLKLFRRNNMDIGVSYLDWNHLENMQASINPDVIIGADIVYDPSIMEPLSKVIKHFFVKNKNLEVYIESVIRSEKTFELFCETLEKNGFTLKKLNQDKPTFLVWDIHTEKCLLQISYP